MCRMGTGVGLSFPKGSVLELKIVDFIYFHLISYFHFYFLFILLFLNLGLGIA